MATRNAVKNQGGATTAPPPPERAEGETKLAPAGIPKDVRPTIIATLPDGRCYRATLFHDRSVPKKFRSVDMGKIEEAIREGRRYVPGIRIVEYDPTTKTEIAPRVVRPAMIDLGFANGWEKKPEVVTSCEEQGHKPSWEKISGSVSRITCEVCGYTYRTDSGD